MSEYTDQNLIDDIAWLYSGHDSGQRDDVRKQRVADALRADDRRAIRVLTACAQDLLKPPYTIEDVASFIRFLDYYLAYSL
jgi:hypothetical protein